MHRFFLLAFSGLALAFVNVANAQEMDWKQIDAALGRTAAVTGEIHRYGFPRTDLDVTLDGVTIKPAFALGGWVAFIPAHGSVMIMGDLVLLETEINPVMKKLLDSGLSITAIHNHLLRASPAPFYMHVGGQGDPVEIATTIRAALAESKTPLGATPAAAAAPPAIDLDTAKLDDTIGVKGHANGGVYQFTVPRRDPVTEMGVALPPGPTGVAIAINFQPTGGGKAAITGDFVLMGEEVNPVIRAFRANGIDVTAIHSHMLDEQPRLFFVHFWANDDFPEIGEGLARGN